MLGDNVFRANLGDVLNRQRGSRADAAYLDLLIRSGRTIDAIRMDGWRIDVRYPEDRDEAERRLQETSGSVEGAAVDAVE